MKNNMPVVSVKYRVEFSKKLLYVNYTVLLVVIIAAFILMWYTSDVSPLGYIISGVFALVTASTSFYYWKAKNENMIKMGYKGGENNDEDKLDTEIDIP